MLKTFKVRTGNYTICRLLQLNAFEAGYKWVTNDSTTVKTWNSAPTYGLAFGWDRHEIFYSRDKRGFDASESIEISPADAIKTFTTIILENIGPSIYIGDNSVEFLDNGEVKIYLGRDSYIMPFEDLETIYKHAKTKVK